MSHLRIHVDFDWTLTHEHLSADELMSNQTHLYKQKQGKTFLDSLLKFFAELSQSEEYQIH